MPRNPLVKLECNRRWRANNREKSREASDRWHKNHREHHLSTREEWRRKRREKYPELVHLENRRWNLKKNFNMTVEEYELLLQSQNGVCAICGELNLAKNKRYLGVDHNHDTGANRGLLCNLCNAALHRIEYDPDWGNKALTYLAKYKGDN